MVRFKNTNSDENRKVFDELTGTYYLMGALLEMGTISGYTGTQSVGDEVYTWEDGLLVSIIEVDLT